MTGAAALRPFLRQLGLAAAAAPRPPACCAAAAQQALTAGAVRHAASSSGAGSDSGPPRCGSGASSSGSGAASGSGGAPLGGDGLLAGGVWAELRAYARFLLPGRWLAVFYRTPPPIAAAMLRLARVGPDDVVGAPGRRGGGGCRLGELGSGGRGRGSALHPTLLPSCSPY
jgi:hypothetical protein